MSDIPEDIMKAARAAMAEADGRAVVWEGPLIDAIARSIMAERERCAVLVENYGKLNPRIRVNKQHVADAIRGQK